MMSTAGYMMDIGLDMRRLDEAMRKIRNENLIMDAPKGMAGKNIDLGAGLTKELKKDAKDSKEQRGAMLGGITEMGKTLLPLAGISLGIAGISQTLQKSSALLGGALGVLEAAMIQFFRPFGDALGAILIPIFVQLYKWSFENQKLLGSVADNAGAIIPAITGLGGKIIEGILNVMGGKGLGIPDLDFAPLVTGIKLWEVLGSKLRPVIDLLNPFQMALASTSETVPVANDAFSAWSELFSWFGSGADSLNSAEGTVQSAITAYSNMFDAMYVSTDEITDGVTLIDRFAGNMSAVGEELDAQGPILSSGITGWWNWVNMINDGATELAGSETAMSEAVRKYWEHIRLLNEKGQELIESTNGFFDVETARLSGEGISPGTMPFESGADNIPSDVTQATDDRILYEGKLGKILESELADLPDWLAKHIRQLLEQGMIQQAFNSFSLAGEAGGTRTTSDILGGHTAKVQDLFPELGSFEIRDAFEIKKLVDDHLILLKKGFVDESQRQLAIAINLYESRLSNMFRADVDTSNMTQQELTDLARNDGHDLRRSSTSDIDHLNAEQKAALATGNYADRGGSYNPDPYNTGYTADDIQYVQALSMPVIAHKMVQQSDVSSKWANDPGMLTTLSAPITQMLNRFIEISQAAELMGLEFQNVTDFMAKHSENTSIQIHSEQGNELADSILRIFELNGKTMTDEEQRIIKLLDILDVHLSEFGELQRGYGANMIYTNPVKDGEFVRELQMVFGSITEGLAEYNAENPGELISFALDKFGHNITEVLSPETLNHIHEAILYDQTILEELFGNSNIELSNIGLVLDGIKQIDERLVNATDRQTTQQVRHLADLVGGMNNLATLIGTVASRLDEVKASIDGIDLNVEVSTT